MERHYRCSGGYYTERKKDITMPVPVKTLTDIIQGCRINRPIESISDLVELFSTELDQQTFQFMFVEPASSLKVEDGLVTYMGVQYPCQDVCSLVTFCKNHSIELLWRDHIYIKTIQK